MMTPHKGPLSKVFDILLGGEAIFSVAPLITENLISFVEAVQRKTKCLLSLSMLN